MVAYLQKRYFLLVGPAAIALAAVACLRHQGLVAAGGAAAPRWLSLTLFVAAGSFSLALPVFYRSLFAHRHRSAKEVAAEDFRRFQVRLLGLSLVSPYLAVAAAILPLQRFYFGGVVLFALYAAYYYFPSQRRIRLDERIFRVR